MWRIKALSSGLYRPGDPKTEESVLKHTSYSALKQDKEREGGGGVRLDHKNESNREQRAGCREDHLLEAYPGVRAFSK